MRGDNNEHEDKPGKRKELQQQRGWCANTALRREKDEEEGNVSSLVSSGHHKCSELLMYSLRRLGVFGPYHVLEHDVWPSG